MRQGGHVAAEHLGGDRHSGRLPADDRVVRVIESVLDEAPAAHGRASLDPAVAFLQAQRFGHMKLSGRGLLQDDPNAVECLDHCTGRTVQPGHLGRIDPDLAVVDLQAGQRGQHVFDHLDMHAPLLKVRAARHFNAMVHVGGNAGMGTQIAANENDSRVDLRRSELDANLFSAPVAESGHRDGIGDCSL